MSDIPVTPTINLSRVPLNERLFARKCQENLSSMSKYVMYFEYAVRLFFYTSAYYTVPQLSLSVTPADLSQWRLIAARDGAMSINHFAEAFDGVNFCTAPAQSQFLSDQIDRVERRKASVILRDKFPKFKAIRNAIAHAAELLKTPQSEEAHIVHGPLSIPGIIEADVTSKVFIQDSFRGNTYFTTFDGEVQQYDIDYTSLQALQQALEHCYASFSAVIVN